MCLYYLYLFIFFVNFRKQNEIKSENLTVEETVSSKVNEPANQVIDSSSGSSQSSSSSSSQAADSADKFNLEDFIKKQLQQNFKDRLFMLNVEKCLVEFLKNDK